MIRQDLSAIRVETKVSLGVKDFKRVFDRDPQDVEELLWGLECILLGGEGFGWVELVAENENDWDDILEEGVSNPDYPEEDKAKIGNREGYVYQGLN